MRGRSPIFGLMPVALAAITTCAVGCRPDVQNNASSLGAFAKRIQSRSGLITDDSSTGHRPHVLLISLDTLRADHLGAYGYTRATSPFLDRLAASGVRFERVFSQSPKTAPSHMSVFTGLYPSTHGAHFIYATEPPSVIPAAREHQLLAEILQDAGYQTAAWTGGGQVSRRAGFARGFDRFTESLGNISPKKMKGISRWFRRNADEPCFLFVHTYQIHDPYTPPAPYDTMFDDGYNGWVMGDRNELRKRAGNGDFSSLHDIFWRKTGRKVDSTLFTPQDVDRLVSLYDGGIRYTDDVLSGFFEDLQSFGLLDNTLVVIMADHGEEFSEHGGFLHEMLYQETLHVPLILFQPARLPIGRVIGAQVPLIDLGPTILDLVGLEKPTPMEGHSLRPLLESTTGVDRPVFSEAPWIHRNHQRSLRDSGFMVYDKGDRMVELYHIADDPLERFDVASELPGVLEEMESAVVAFVPLQDALGSVPREHAEELSSKEIEALRALGYIE